MKLVFYVCGFVSVISTFSIIFSANPMYALLYFTVSILSLSGVFFSLGAIFSGVVEVIIYVGAIMVLFAFTVMMLNSGKKIESEEIQWLSSKYWLIPVLISILLLISILYGLSFISDNQIMVLENLDIKRIGNKLLSTYYLLVEFSSMMLLAALVVVFHISKSKT